MLNGKPAATAIVMKEATRINHLLLPAFGVSDALKRKRLNATVNLIFFPVTLGVQSRKWLLIFLITELINGQVDIIFLKN